MTISAPAVRPMRLGALSLLVAVLLVLLSALPGLAHDTLTDSSPGDGDSGPPPTEVTLTYSGEIAPVGAAVEVTGPDGTVSEGEPAVEGVEVTQPLAADLPAGDYQVVWRVTSSDGHPISGEFGFTVEETEEETGDDSAGATAPAPSPGEDDAAATTEDAGDDTVAPTSDDAGQDATAPGTGDPAEESGMPVWTWVVIVLALVLLAGVVARVVRNAR